MTLKERLEKVAKESGEKTGPYGTDTYKMEHVRQYPPVRKMDTREMYRIFADTHRNYYD